MGFLEVSRCRGWCSISCTSGSSGTRMIESNSLEVTNSLRMSGGAMLHMTGNQSVCVGFSAPDIVRMAQFNRVSTS